MKKTVLVMALAAVMVFAFASAAFADHAPNFYVAWDGTGVNSNGPHTDYQLTTEKCNVCHAVHRAAVPGEFFTGSWTTTGSTTDTQMLLRSSVSDACNYCHIDTAIGGVRLWNGLSLNRTATGAWVETGYEHGNGCSSCHAVHGAKTFSGPIASKNLRWDIKAAVVAASGPEHLYTDPKTSIASTAGVQDEIWATNGSQPGRVATGSISLFSDLQSCIEGDEAPLITGTTTKQAQSTAFCTGCHMNYSSASEIVVNIDQDMALFQGGYGWIAVTGYGTYTYKNHPVGPATTAFAAGGDTTAETSVAWSDASSCRACHDAGVIDAGAGVVENSYPHVTPGYWKFMGAGTSVASMTAGYANADDYADLAYYSTPGSFSGAKAAGSEDGHCLKCHINAAGTMGVGKTY